jgi:PAS domain S-box-containing protein
MKHNANQTKGQLIMELAELRQRVTELETLEIKHRQAEEALAQERNLLRTLIDNLPDYIYIKDTESRFIIGNDAVARVMGAASPEELVGKTDFDFYPHDLAIHYYTDERAIVESGQPLINKEEPVIDQVTGVEQWLSTTKVLLHDNQGKIVGIVGMGRDITERKANEETLQQSKQQIENILESITDAFFALDREWRFTYVNRRAEQILRRPRTELLNKSIWVEFPETVGSKFYTEYQRAMTDQVTVEFEEFYEPLQGWFKVHAYPYAQGLSVYFRDVTERKHSEAVLAQRAAQLALINDIGSKIAAVLELDSLLDRAARLVQETFNYHHVALFLLDKDRAKLKAIAGSYKTYFPPEHSQKLSQGIIGWVATHGERLLVNDVSRESRYISLIADQTETRAELCLPIQIAGRTVGVLDIQSPQLGGFSENDIVAMEILTNQIAVAIENARLYQAVQQELSERKHTEEALRLSKQQVLNILDRFEELVDERTIALKATNERLQQAQESLKRYAERLKILQEIDRSILAAQSPEAIAQAALHHIERLVPCRQAAVVGFDFETYEAVMLAAFVKGEAKVMVGQHPPLDMFGIAEELRQSKVSAPENILILAQPPLALQALPPEGVCSFINIPLVARGKLIGSLNLGADDPAAFTAEHVDIAREVADPLALTIQQARLHEQVQDYAAELEQRVAERTAKLEEINDELKSFTFSVSHDLRAPLRAVQGFAEALLQDYTDKLDTEGQDYARRILAAAQRMDHLIQDLLTYSRLSRADFRLQPVDLNVVVADVLASFEVAGQEQKAQITVEEPLPQVIGDYSTLVQVMDNLLNNAIKFVSPDVRPRVRVWAEFFSSGSAPSSGEERGWVRLWVEDNGIGLAPEYHDRIFQIFERLHGIETYPGTGVGLAIVRKGVLRLGGQVGVESSPGQGSKFWIELPKAIKKETKGRVGADGRPPLRPEDRSG